MIVDCFTFCGEYDLLEIRLNVLNDYVDQFIIIEAPTTFSGQIKPLYWAERDERFEEWEHKIKYFVIDENYSDEEIALAESSPNTQGAYHWKHEFLQKESIKKALTHLKDDDLVFIGDVDEIWELTGVPLQYIYGDMPYSGVFKLGLKVYSYYLNNRSSEIFYGTIIGKYKDIKDECLNHLRMNARKCDICGWHFTSMGGIELVRRKLNDSYTEETYNNDWVKLHLEDNIVNNKDFLGRSFTYKTDESEWPQYLKDNRDKYVHLLKT